MIIRPVRIADIAALSELAAKTYSDAFGHTFSKADLAAHLRNNLSQKYFLQAIAEDIILVADLENSLVGFTQFGAVQMPMVARSPAIKSYADCTSTLTFEAEG